MQQLKTDEFPLGLDRTFRNDLIDNFEAIQQNLNELNDDQSQQSIELNQKLTDIQQQINQKLTDIQQQMNDRINRIILGTDEDAIRLVVTAILQEQGVIK